MSKIRKGLLNLKNYPYLKWGQYFKNIVKLDQLPLNRDWYQIFKDEFKKDYVNRIEKYFARCLNKTDGKIEIFPYPELVFNAFNATFLDDLKVVIVGQDPYPKFATGEVPQAMGLSFSVPVDVTVPSSLQNIYKNLEKFGHLIEKPKHGNLISWSYQGCLMLNTALTVQKGIKNSHKKFWTPFTKFLIKYLSKNFDNLVFVLWGGPAVDNLLEHIDKKRHKVTISSHPSGFSYMKPLRDYPPFIETDHFGKINKYLIKHNKKPIIWNF